MDCSQQVIGFNIMNDIMYILLDFEENPQTNFARYLVDRGKKVYFVHYNDYNENNTSFCSLKTNSQSPTYKSFLKTLIPLFTGFYNSDYKFLTILPSIAYPIYEIDSYEKNIISSDKEFANITNAKFDKSLNYKTRFSEIYFPFGYNVIRRPINKILRKCGIKRNIPWGFMLHYGPLYFCLKKDTIGKVLDNLLDKRFMAIFRWLQHPLFYIIPSAIFKSCNGLLEDFNDFFASTNQYINLSEKFYNDHLQLLLYSNKFFVANISPYAKKLFDALPIDSHHLTSSLKPLPEIYNNKIKYYSNKSRIPWIYPSWILQDLYYNRKKYNVIITFSQINLEYFFSNATHRSYGFIFNKDCIDYNKSPGHPVYLNNIWLRNYKPTTFLYDIINSEYKTINFLLSPDDGRNILDIIANDKNANVYTYFDDNILKYIKLCIECNSHKTVLYYSLTKKIPSNYSKINDFKNTDFDKLQRQIHFVNTVMYKRNILVSQLMASENNESCIY